MGSGGLHIFARTALLALSGAGLTAALPPAAFAYPPSTQGAVPINIHPTLGSSTRQLGAISSRGHAQNTCYVSATNMNFGTYDIFTTAPLTSTMTFTVNCGKGYRGNGYLGTGYVFITFSTGSSGTYTNRTMSNGTDKLDYNLYASTAYTTVVGNGSNNTTYYYAGCGSCKGFSGTATVYGRLPAQQNVSTGTYTDVVTVTMLF